MQKQKVTNKVTKKKLTYKTIKLLEMDYPTKHFPVPTEYELRFPEAKCRDAIWTHTNKEPLIIFL